MVVVVFLPVNVGVVVIKKTNILVVRKLNESRMENTYVNNTLIALVCCEGFVIIGAEAIEISTNRFPLDGSPRAKKYVSTCRTVL